MNPIDSTRTVAALKRGESGTIAAFTDPRLAGKLISMGIRPGAEVKLVRRGALGRCCYIKVQRYQFALRTCEADCICLRSEMHD